MRFLNIVGFTLRVLWSFDLKRILEEIVMIALILVSFLISWILCWSLLGIEFFGTPITLCRTPMITSAANFLMIWGQNWDYWDNISVLSQCKVAWVFVIVKINLAASHGCCPDCLHTLQTQFHVSQPIETLLNNSI